MQFGIKSAQEVFQKRMFQLLGDLPGVETDIDDILVWGTNHEEHDKRLTAALTRCEEINLTFNKNSLPEVSYIGHILNSEGIKPDPEAIKEIPPPTERIECLAPSIIWQNSFQTCPQSLSQSEKYLNLMSVSIAEPQKTAFAEKYFQSRQSWCTMM